MARRALIIAIEQYAQMQDGLAQRLEGTHKSALDFRQWLVDEQGIDPADIELCTEDADFPGRTAGATRQDIEDALVRLRDAGRNMTEHFYAYLAGHGFSYTDIDALRLADVLLLQEYRRRDISGNACLKIDAVQSWLRRALGPGEHFYFVDCCRNPVDQGEIKCSDPGLALDDASNGDPTIHTLYSTIDGAMAAVGSGFCPVLISGLKGTGRAKVWLEDDRGMAVKFLPVSRFVAQKLPGQPVDPGTWGPGEGLIREFIPAPCYELKVIVENAAPEDNFTVNASTTRGQQLAPTTFVGPEWTSTAWPPDSYNVTLSTTGHEVEPLDPGPADLYDACTLHFRKGSPSPSAPASPPPASPPPSMTVRAPYGASLRILSMSRPDDVIERTGGFAELFAPGRYRVEMLDRRGAPVAYHEVVMEADRPQVIDLRGFVQSPLRDALLARLPHGAGAVDFSETLGGPTPDQGLDLWLATIGAARILDGAHDDFLKLGPLPLASFFGVPAHGAPVYVLAGFDEPPERVMVTLDGATQKLGAHWELPGLFELSATWAPAGSHLVTLEVDGLAPLTLATASVADRVTLVTFSRHAGEAIRMRQLILPLPHLIHTYWRNPPFDTVRRSIEVQRQFESGRELSALLGEDELIDLLYFKWTEAVMCLLGAYELARRGHVERLRTAAYNLQQHFPELPDSHVIARLAGLQAAPPAFAPLVLDGFLGLEARPTSSPGAELDHRGPWTLWRGGTVTPGHG